MGKNTQKVRNSEFSRFTTPPPMSYQVIQQTRSTGSQRTGPVKKTALEQAKKENNPPPKALATKPGQKTTQRRFGTNLTNRPKIRTAIQKSEEIEHAYFSEAVMHTESPLDRLDLRKLREPWDTRKRTPPPLLEDDPFSLVGFDINPALGTFAVDYTARCSALISSQNSILMLIVLKLTLACQRLILTCQISLTATNHHHYSLVRCRSRLTSPNCHGL